jgi:hypothetical protein
MEGGFEVSNALAYLKSFEGDWGIILCDAVLIVVSLFVLITIILMVVRLLRKEDD